MFKFASVAMAAALATASVLPATAQAAEGNAAVTAGKSLYAANGARIGSIYKVTESGSAQLIIDGRVVNVPVSTISETNGKLTTTLTRAEVVKAH